MDKEELLHNMGYNDYTVDHDGTIVCPCGHRIEDDGECPNGHKSPLRQMGMI